MNPRSSILLVLTVFFLAASVAVSQESAAPDYRVGPKDLLEIQVYEVPELSGESRVNEQGQVILPLIGEVQVQGLTPEAVARRLKEVLEARYVHKATVTVRIKEYRSTPITVVGAVRQPGPLVVSGRWTLLEALNAAGGLAAENSGEVYVLRRAKNGLTDQVTIPVQALMYQGDPRMNIPIFPGDLINIPAAAPVTVFLLGEVARTGEITFGGNEEATLLTTIAKAGGLGERASKKLRIKRKIDGRLQEIVVDYKAVLAGRADDVELQDGDIILVKESFF